MAGVLVQRLAGQTPVDIGGLASFRQGLKEGGYEEGRNVEILYHDRLPSLAADLGLPSRCCGVQICSIHRHTPEFYD